MYMKTVSGAKGIICTSILDDESCGRLPSMHAQLSPSMFQAYKFMNMVVQHNLCHMHGFIRSAQECRSSPAGRDSAILGEKKPLRSGEGTAAPAFSGDAMEDRLIWLSAELAPPMLPPPLRSCCTVRHSPGIRRCLAGLTVRRSEAAVSIMHNIHVSQSVDHIFPAT